MRSNSSERLMLKSVRKTIINQLWQTYHQTTSDIREIELALKQRHITNLPLDHLAIIDLPGSKTGIPVLQELFSLIGYTFEGCGYLPDKQNDFTWLAEVDSRDQLATNVLPQIVVADFRLEEMPADIRAIITHYAEQSKPAPIKEMQQLAADIHHQNAAITMTHLILTYLSGRDWPLPTVAEFKRVQAFNELLAWVLVFGRRPNHFTLSIHLLHQFDSLLKFHQFIKNDVKLELNHEGGIIKGDKTTGIAQGSTVGIKQTIQLADGSVALPTGFVEFVWRYPHNPIQKPENWDDYFTGFVAQHANHVIESLYGDSTQP
jgi:hypothetical protein